VNWSYKTSQKAIKQLKKLGKDAARRIVTFLDTRISGSEDPRRFGKALKGEFGVGATESMIAASSAKLKTVK
jgi:mRNA interferase RelE/StbE